MILREIRRFCSNNALLVVAGTSILALGSGVATLAFALIISFSSLVSPGMRAVGYATIAEETQGGGSVGVSWRKLDELRSLLGSRATLSAYSRLITVSLETGGSAHETKVAAVSNDFFNHYTHHLSAGRNFLPGEEELIGQHIVIISLSLATSLFQSPANAINRSVVISGTSYQVIGVAPAGFHGLFGDSADAWVPSHCVIPLVINVSPEQLPVVDAWKDLPVFYGVALSEKHSSSSLSGALSHILPLHAPGQAALHVSQGLTRDPVRDITMRRWLHLGMLLSIIFTILSSLNFSMLLIARTSQRAGEIRLKMALGAPVSRLLAELIVGPMAMVCAGTIAGLVLCVYSLIWTSRISPFYGDLVLGSRHAAIRMAVFQLLMTAVIGIAVAVVPAMGVRHPGRIAGAGHTVTAGRYAVRALRLVVVVQSALCMGTLVLAGMVVSSFVSLLHVSLGYEPSHLFVVRFAPNSPTIKMSFGNHHSSPEVQDLESVIARISAVSGVESVGYSTGVPFKESADSIGIQRLDALNSPPRTVNEIRVSPGFASTMRIRIFRGLGFSPHGIGVNEILLNETLAKELWPNGDPVGRSVRLTYPAIYGISESADVARVVGITDDARLSGYTETPTPTIFSSIEGQEFMDIYPTFVIRGSLSQQLIRKIATAAGASYLPEYSLASVDTVGEQVVGSLSKEKQRTWLALSGAGLMSLVAYIGLYGSLFYFVNSKRREIAIRIGLGASRWAIRQLVLAQAATLTGFAVIVSIFLWPFLAQLSSGDYLGRLSWSPLRAVFITVVSMLASVLVAMPPAEAAVSVSPSDLLKEI